MSENITNLYNKAKLSHEDVYGIYYKYMLLAGEEVIFQLQNIENQNIENQNLNGSKMFHQIHTRIKSPESMLAKLEKRNLPIKPVSTVTEIKDGVGIRIICDFLDDVLTVADAISQSTSWEVLETKDYISKPKPNGYRSYHLILAVPIASITIPVEVQIRTISQDAWASLEHSLKYKKDIANQKLIQSELKRCADELASTDISMQTIRDLINVTFNPCHEQLDSKD